MNLLSITTPPLAVLIGQRGFQLNAILEVMYRMRKESLVDGFEFQNLAEWDVSGPPRDKAQFQVRLKVWEYCEKYSVDELVVMLKESNLPILSVHANRDVGIHLCSDIRREIQRGKQLIYDSLNLAQQVGAQICVFHLWDTWKQRIDPTFLKRTLVTIADEYPKVKAAVENVPINLPNHTPFDVVKEFDWITLDLRWAGMYNELDKFEDIRDRIVNVHLRGRLESEKWEIYHAPFTFYEVVKKIKEEWDYSGLLTVEPEGGLKRAKWTDFSAAMTSLR
ncbi:MAG: sugar phosphate isomerase/epimerase family protein [Candidatus Hermodarchaeota archaeon]